MDYTEFDIRFAELAPWVSGFKIEGKWYGGEYNPIDDPRVTTFMNFFPACKNNTVLEIGCLEGGHSVRLKQLGVEDVICIEGRAANIAKAKFIHSCFGYKDILLIKADAESYDYMTGIGTVGAVFCCGVLYHLSNPGRFIQKMAEITNSLYLWTHYHQKTSTYLDDGGEENPTAGLTKKALWLSRGALFNLVEKHGFKIAYHHEEANKNGPAVTLILKK